MEEKKDEDSPFTERSAEEMETDKIDKENAQSSAKNRQKILEEIEMRKGKLTIDDVELSNQELKAIEKKLLEVEKDLVKSIEETPVNVKGVYLSVIVSLIFIVLSIFINRVDKSSPLSLSIIDIFENTIWAGDPNRYFKDIQSLTDLDAYYRTIFFPGIFTNTFINKHNYVVGLRLTLKKARLVSNPFSEYEEAVWKVRKDPNLGAGIQQTDGEEINDLGIFNYTSGGGFDKAGGYVEFFCNLTLEEAVAKWRIMKPIWLIPNNFVSITAELLVHNGNLMTTLYYYQTVERTSTGRFNLESDSVGIFPEAYETWTLESKIVVILGTIYIVGFLIQIFKMVQILLRVCTTLWTKLKLDVAWHEYLEFMTLALVITSISLFLQNVIGNIGKLQIPIHSESEFIDFITYCRNFKIFIRVTAVAALLIILRILVILKSKFPSFGVLFDTINMAKKDIINFGLITLLMIVAFSLSAYLGFGIATGGFSTFGATIASLWSSLFGRDIISEIRRGSISISGVFYVAYMSLFYFIILNTFLAIVLSVYTELRKRSQLLLEAKARMLAEDSHRLIEILINLLLFRIKSTLEEDAIEYQALSVKTTANAQEQEEINERLKKLENAILHQSRQNIFSIVKYNFGQVQLALRGAGSTLLTREQMMLKYKNTIMTMEQEKKKNEILKKMKENEVNYNFKLFAEMVLYIIFIVIYVMSVKYRMRIEDSYAMNKLIYDSIAVPQFVYKGSNTTFLEIYDPGSAYEFLSAIMVPYIESTTVGTQNYFLTSPKIRFNMNRYKIHKNKNTFSSSVIAYVSDDPGEWEESGFQGKSSLTKFRYIEPGTKATFNEEGGCTYELYPYLNFKNAFINFQADDIIGNQTSSIVFEWVVYNANMNMFSYAYIQLSLDISGEITIRLSSQSAELDAYSAENKGRAALDIIFILFIVYFISQFISEWWLIMRGLIGQRQNIQRGKRAVRDVLDKLLGNNQDNENQGIGFMVQMVWRKIQKFVVVIIFTIKQLIQSLWIFLRMDGWQLLQLLSVILSIIQFSYLVRLISSDFINNYEINETWADNIGEFGYIAKLYQHYGVVSCFNALLIFLRVLKYFEFSKQTSLLTDIFDSAKLDLLFYIIMFFLMIIGYTIMGYLIFGQALDEFQHFNYSLLSTFNVLIGKFSVGRFLGADGKIGMLWFITLSLVFNLLLINIFIAIVYAHYNTNKADRNANTVGFLKKIILVIKARIKRKKYMDWENSGDEKSSTKANQLSDSEDEIPNNSVKQEFEVEEAKPINYTVNAWLKVLEEMLLVKSNQKINLPNLKDENNIEEKIIPPAPLQEVVFVEESQWLQEDPLGKLRIWKQLSILHNDYLRRKIEKAIQQGLEPPELSELSERQIQLWEITPPQDKLSMWMGEESFQNEERVLVWNAALFDKKRFGDDIDEWNIDIQRECWLDFDEKKKKDFVKKWIDDIKPVTRAYKAATNPIGYLLKQEWLSEDKRMLLWVSLSKHEKVKMTLYLNQHNRVEAEILSYLLLQERDNNVFILDDSDALITSTLDSKLYDKLYESAVFQAENNAMETSKERVEETRYEIKNLKNFQVHLEEDLKQFKRQNKTLKEKGKNLKARCESLLRGQE
ncbi:unnamed protein product [Blepharisma stoltei]|uniref:Polycystin cation channel PKD1/PKD2 domain-containing protein n=1 Tax=Blepharisma stoltei TaxID=1481888 RepID=A0AAU9JDL1_9CILI|nr:unnamed protein product [Blepharisma stoltei]